MSKKIVVTGGSGKAGRACIRHLLDHGYAVLSVDTVPPAERLCPFIAADLSDYGQTIDVLSGVDFGAPDVAAIVHLAAIPASRLKSNAVTFRNNTLSDYNVFEAARRLGIKDIVWASSETVLGLPFDAPPPYVPVDEDYSPRPESAYSLSKVLSEEMARQFCRWEPAAKIIGLRFSNIMEPHDYARFAAWQDDARKRKWNLWGYIDARDAALAIRLALEYPKRGADVFVIANDDSVMDRPNEALLNEVFPGVPRKRAFAPNETLLAIEKAKKLLGFKPAFSWRTAK
jgi:nucleoside-diphosphate-sugar epimerase